MCVCEVASGFSVYQSNPFETARLTMRHKRRECAIFCRDCHILTFGNLYGPPSKVHLRVCAIYSESTPPTRTHSQNPPGTPPSVVNANPRNELRTLMARHKTCNSRSWSERMITKPCLLAKSAATPFMLIIWLCLAVCCYL